MCYPRQVLLLARQVGRGIKTLSASSRRWGLGKWIWGYHTMPGYIRRRCLSQSVSCCSRQGLICCSLWESKPDRKIMDCSICYSALPRFMFIGWHTICRCHCQPGLCLQDSQGHPEWWGQCDCGEHKTQRNLWLSQLDFKLIDIVLHRPCLSAEATTLNSSFFLNWHTA